MFKQKPTISDGKANYVKLVFLNVLFPTMFPRHPEKKNGLEKNGPRKIKTYIENHFNGSKVQINDVYKPKGIKSERSAALREDIFDLMMIYAPPCTSLVSRKTTIFETFLSNFAPCLHRRTRIEDC